MTQRSRDVYTSATIERLDDARILRRDRWVSWGITAAIGIVAFILRLVDIDQPHRITFDETYYAKDAWTLLNLGYEASWPDDADEAIMRGEWDIYHDTASYVVHPQFAKWLIAIGLHFFGLTPLGWRISAAVFGTILIMATTRLARRLSRSTLVGGIAGLLLTFDGLTFVMSRIALLDIFQAAFIVMGVACVVADRDWFRHRLADYLRRNQIRHLDGGYGPAVIWRPWRLMAGIMFGLATACKWNSIYALAAMGIASVIYDYASRRTAGARTMAWTSFAREAPLAFVYLVITAFVTYIVTWWSWLTTDGGWGRSWGADNPDHPLVRAIGAPLASLAKYHLDIYNTHTGSWMASQEHTYDAHPLGWPVIARTIGIAAENDIPPGSQGCPATATEDCLRVVSGIGTPALWWLAAAALLVGIVKWWAGRDWRYAFPVMTYLVLWISWMPNADRPMYFFYTIVLIPFATIVLAMLLGEILGPADGSARKQRAAIVTAIIVLIIINFWFIYPIVSNQLMTRSAWSLRMWSSGWI